MTATPDDTQSGYLIERLFANELSFTGLPVSADMPATEAPLEFGWDWNVEGPGRITVRFSMRVSPTQGRPERVHVALAAAFLRQGETSVPLLEFVHKQAPTLLMPYLREAISSLTSRGLHGALLLPPINMLAVMGNLDPGAAQGVQQLQDDPALAASLGVASGSWLGARARVAALPPSSSFVRLRRISDSRPRRPRPSVPAFPGGAQRGRVGHHRTRRLLRPRSWAAKRGIW